MTDEEHYEIISDAGEALVRAIQSALDDGLQVQYTINSMEIVLVDGKRVVRDLGPRVSRVYSRQ